MSQVSPLSFASLAHSTRKLIDAHQWTCPKLVYVASLQISASEQCPSFAEEHATFTLFSLHHAGVRTAL